MLRIVKTEVNECQCDNCGHPWRSLTTPSICPSCRTRAWNGAKKAGRPSPSGPRIIKHYEVIEDRW